MFVLAELKDTVRIPPWEFKRKLNDAITDELNRKLANKVYHDVGLCIALHDITKIEESYIFPGDGASHTKVVFLTLGFFEDIVIPPHKLQHPSRFDQMEQAWVWEYDTGDGEKHDLFMDAGEIIRFRVISETFTEALPTGPNMSGETETSEAKNTSPYSLGGAIDEQGLGLLTWWENT
ncbi:DNA-directed RNA polymerase III subunit RPC8 [Melipona quadrifasciata]|uniref:DNA-directed RNA polymerase III subunit RPC8 n=1 Tax=Melipona quadrifasciata TaxID=166423 RepID=A0A0M9A7B4_9HYME|nr:DNA-directed RNA polymerase III subunit RPC8 [Melipona quadrifasciata]